MVFDPLHNVLSIGGTSQERLGKKASYNEAGPEMALNHGYPNFQQGVDANRLPPPRQHNGLAAMGAMAAFWPPSLVPERMLLAKAIQSRG